MTQLEKPQAFLFDWDNTLVNTWPVITLALNSTLAYMGHEPWSEERVKRDVKRSMRDSFPELFGERWEEAATRYQNDYRALHLEHLAPLPNALTLLETLAKTGAFLGVVSNKRGASLRTEIEHLGWKSFFQSTIGADDATRDKPHPDPAILALKDSGIPQGKHIWFIGDTGVDLECAHAIGATAILYGDHGVKAKEHDGFSFDAHVRNHEALLVLLTESKLIAP